MGNKLNFSIISVCFNCVGEVEKTVESLKAQTCKDYEYIVVDGKSSDGTLESVNELIQGMENVTIVSEKDDGIYDAMNKGVKLARGKYIFFLNMGDTFYSNDILENVEKRLASQADIYYGDIERDEKIVCQQGFANLFAAVYRGYMICHQSIFASTSLTKEILFDTTYKICADRKWLITALKRKAKIEYIEEVISVYDTKGQSSDYKKFKEESLSVTKEVGYMPYVFLRLKLFICERIKK